MEINFWSGEIFLLRKIASVVGERCEWKSGLKEDNDLRTNNPCYSFKFIHLEVQTFHRTVLSLSHNFVANQSKRNSVHFRDQR